MTHARNVVPGRLWSAVALLVTFAACSSSDTRGAGTEHRDPHLMAGPLQDAQIPRQSSIILPSGKEIQGTILHDDYRETIIESGDYVYRYPKLPGSNATRFTKENWEQIARPASASATSGYRPQGATTWFPRLSQNEQVEFGEITWVDPHTAGTEAGCLGDKLAKNLKDTFDLRLFVPAGGKIVLRDESVGVGGKAGFVPWHSHAWKAGVEKDAFQPGTDQSPLTLTLPANDAAFPDAAVFVSQAVDFNNRDNPKCTSYAPGDVVSVRVSPLTAHEGHLVRQQFMGGKAVETPMGKLWAGSLAKGPTQWFFYTLDPSGKHSKVLRNARVGVGIHPLIPDYVLDVEAADGTLVGRVFVLPFVPGSADSTGTVATLYSGDGKDPAPLVTVPMAPRISVQLPPQAPSTKATLLLSAYGVQGGTPETLTVAHGTERPAKGLTLNSRPLEAASTDEVLKLDMSQMAADRFPVVAYVWVRRTFTWTPSGGALNPAPAFALPAAPAPKLTGAPIRNPHDAPHCTPLLFAGEKASSQAAAPAGASSVALPSAFLGDAMGREAGALSQIVNTSAGGGASAPTGVTSSGEPIYVQTVLNIQPPSQVSSMGSLGSLGGSAPQGGVFMDRTPGWNGGPTPNPWGMGAFGPVGTGIGDQRFDYRGRPVDNGAARAQNWMTQQQQAGGGASSDIGYTDPISNTTVPIRRKPSP